LNEGDAESAEPADKRLANSGKRLGYPSGLEERS